MPYHSAGTRERLLSAAFAEFVEHGLAGGRVDRIAARAQANKQAIYAHFGSKEGLFDAVLANRLGQLVSAVTLQPDDLAGYALGLFDYLVAHPDDMRLTLWKRLERPEIPAEEIASYTAKATQIAARHDLRRPPWSAIDVLLIVLGIVSAWEIAAPEIRRIGTPDNDADRQAGQRAAVAAAVPAVLAALGATPAEDRTPAGDRTPDAAAGEA